MSRAVVYQAILDDPVLQGMGFHGEPGANVLVSYDGNQRPSDTMFMVLRWETEDIGLRGDDATFTLGPRHLAIWVHMYREFSTDFNHIDKTIAQLDNLLTNILNVVGGDGYTLTLVEPEGHSRDLRDEGYQTYCRSASYRVLSRVT